jgi:hypothetical protein
VLHSGLCYTAACATQRHVLHSGLCYTAACATQRPVLHSGLCFAAACTLRGHQSTKAGSAPPMRVLWQHACVMVAATAATAWRLSDDAAACSLASKHLARAGELHLAQRCWRHSMRLALLCSCSGVVYSSLMVGWVLRSSWNTACRACSSVNTELRHCSRPGQERAVYHLASQHVLWCDVCAIQRSASRPALHAEQQSAQPCRDGASSGCTCIGRCELRNVTGIPPLGARRRA